MYKFTMRDAVSAAANWTSEALDLGDLQVYGISVYFSGSDVEGTLKLQGSIDKVSWYDIAGSSQAVTLSTGHMWSASQAGYEYVRLDWAYVSGTGNMTVKAIIKQNPITNA